MRPPRPPTELGPQTQMTCPLLPWLLGGVLDTCAKQGEKCYQCRVMVFDIGLSDDTRCNVTGPNPVRNRATLLSNMPQLHQLPSAVERAHKSLSSTQMVSNHFRPQRVMWLSSKSTGLGIKRPGSYSQLVTDPAVCPRASFLSIVYLVY